MINEPKLYATADGPRDEMCQSNFFQLLYNSVETCCTSQEQIEIMELKGYIRPTCNKLCASSHHARTRSIVV